ncbi:hypothetical protein DENSPDRAFT_846374 [Dentipellis sp. KUC8613]|nr:hypothetical protein DENSPDRAFT_846374 [Dentipellis sp. KUC8613]
MALVQPTIIRNKHYYMDEGTVVFQVENHVFRVHVEHLRKYSLAFCDMFSLDCLGYPGEGSSDLTPIKLLHVSVLEMETLFDALYDSYLFESDVYFTRERAKAIKRVAQLYDVRIDDLQYRIISVLVGSPWPNDDIHCLSVADIYKTPTDKLRQCLHRIVQRPESLTSDEMRILFEYPEMFCKIIRAREEVFKRQEVAERRVLATSLLVRRVVSEMFGFSD